MNGQHPETVSEQLNEARSESKKQRKLGVPLKPASPEKMEQNDDDFQHIK